MTDRDRTVAARTARRLIAAAALVVAATGATALVLAAGEPDRDLAAPATPSAPASSAEQVNEQAPAIAAGRFLYRAHCENCHGASGRGDGPLAGLLTVPPSDLTVIARRHDGRFPSAELQLVIDGRKDVRGHGGREMPIWGIGLSPRGDDVPAGMVDGRIRNLIAFIESIQVVPAR